jgi:hypothetical protein
MIKTFNRLTLFTCFICFLPFSQANEVHSPEKSSTLANKLVVKPFTSTYSVIHKSDPVGEATRQLKKLADGSFEYSYHNYIEWLIFSDDRQETSILTVDDNKVTSLSYQYKREGTGRDKFYHWSYDHKNSTAKDIKKDRTIKVDYTNGLQDKLSYHLQHRINLINAYKVLGSNKTKELNKQSTFTYPVISTSGAIKDYVYQYDGEEEIILPYGLVKTIKFKREIAEKKRITYAWFAPELDFLLVKLYQIKGGVEQFEAQLTAVTLDD